MSVTGNLSSDHPVGKNAKEAGPTEKGAREMEPARLATRLDLRAKFPGGNHRN